MIINGCAYTGEGGIDVVARAETGAGLVVTVVECGEGGEVRVHVRRRERREQRFDLGLVGGRGN